MRWSGPWAIVARTLVANRWLAGSACGKRQRGRPLNAIVRRHVSGQLRITRTPYEEPHTLNLLVAASNGRLRGALEIYVSTNELSELAEVLKVFPRHKDDVHLWELGSERPEDRWAFYFRLRAFTINARGHCALHVRFSNNKSLPETELSEFCIAAEPSQINHLGALVAEFAKLRHEVLEWNVSEGQLVEKA
jgi:hypothetical protein